MPPPGAPHDAYGPSFVGSGAKAVDRLDADAPEVREWLEPLDDAIFGALGGCQNSLAAARRLWPAAVEALGSDLIEESREQYLRYAVEVTRRFETHEIRNPALAVVALEIIELLTCR